MKHYLIQKNAQFLFILTQIIIYFVFFIRFMMNKAKKD